MAAWKRAARVWLLIMLPLAVPGWTLLPVMRTVALAALKFSHFELAEFAAIHRVGPLGREALQGEAVGTAPISSSGVKADPDIATGISG